MESQKSKRTLKIIDESFNLPQAAAAILNLIGYVTMTVPFATILIGLFLGMWGVNRLSDVMAAILPGWMALVVVVVANGVKLLMVLIAARTVFLTLTVLPPFLPDFIELVRREFRKDFDL